MESACRLSTNVIRLSKSISKHSLRSFLHCAECVFLAPSDSAKFIAFLCKKNRRATKRVLYLCSCGWISYPPDPRCGGPKNPRDGFFRCFPRWHIQE
ncbi:hypothetical protein FD815_29805 [Klebsiella pneumoniae]|nr:hypothetical protein [Klebsiella pneumoniae]MBY5246964.1 hypothetical protein [Klebsiella quasipneumoniae]MDI4505525.1 hypothetical protein [Escherichia coli]TRL56111.1 hypothetical protein FMV79_24575 [Enterobacter hormaechei]HBY0453127.1 hypothetical protein [Klebsiella pneumoniae subsp. pneumoniae]